MSLAVLRTVERLTKERGIPPTLREVAREVDKGLTTVLYHVRRLEAEGLVERDGRMARTLRLTEKGEWK